MCGNCTPLTAQPSYPPEPPADEALLSGDYTKMHEEDAEDEVFVSKYSDTRYRGYQENPELEKLRHTKKHVRKRSVEDKLAHHPMEDIIAQLFADLPSPSVSIESSAESEDNFSLLRDSGSLPSSPVALTTSTVVTPRKLSRTISTSTCAADNKMETPLDFSFLSLTELSELETEEPRALLGKNVPRDEEGKFQCKCLKLNNNHFADLKGIMPSLTKIIFEPAALSWIDLSFNELTHIDPVFCDFPNLQILYLHGNQIADIKEIDKLAGASSLKKLCLHGNPIETTKSYRWYVLSTVLHLQSLDMSGITKADRVTASTWKSTNPTKKKKKRTDE